MAHHATPPAADVEQPHTGLQAELAGDKVVLVLLSLLQGRVVSGVASAGVGHRRTQDHFVKTVRNVVVVTDGGGVAALAMSRVERARPHFLRGEGRRDQGAQAQAT